MWVLFWVHGLASSPLGPWPVDFAEMGENFSVPNLILLLHHPPLRSCNNSMTICQDCGINFPLLSDGSNCNKCRMLEGQSGVERVAIKANCHPSTHIISGWPLIRRKKDNARLVRLFTLILSNHYVMLAATFMVQENPNTLMEINMSVTSWWRSYSSEYTETRWSYGPVG
jgi:hypothetical protein